VLNVTEQISADQEVLEPFGLDPDSAIGEPETADDSALNEHALTSGEQPLRSGTRQEEHVNMEQRPTTALSQATDTQRTPQRAQETLAENLRSVSLAAVAEPYLGSISGLTFAKLTQAVLRRLSPDGRDFVFSPQIGGSAGPIEGATNLHLDFINNMYFDFDQAIDFSMLAGDGTLQTFDDEMQSTITALPDRGFTTRNVLFRPLSHTLPDSSSRRSHVGHPCHPARSGTSHYSISTMYVSSLDGPGHRINHAFFHHPIRGVSVTIVL
jgi:hypothetical protein